MKTYENQFRSLENEAFQALDKALGQRKRPAKPLEAPFHSFASSLQLALLRKSCTPPRQVRSTGSGVSSKAFGSF